jgi:hypothetical protein
MIRDYLVPALKREFAGWEINFAAPPQPVATFAATQEKVGRLMIYDDGDLERRDDKVPVKDVFGLISELTEERGCKCLLILNSERLEKQDSEDFRTMEEKVFDLRLEYGQNSGNELSGRLKRRLS